MSEQDDQEFIIRRQKLDRQNFLVKALDPAVAPRLAPALNAARDLLLDGKWHTWAEVTATALRAAGDVAVKTVNTQLVNAVSCGFLERAGEFKSSWPLKAGKRPAVDTRRLRLIDWPDKIQA